MNNDVMQRGGEIYTVYTIENKICPRNDVQSLKKCNCSGVNRINGLKLNPERMARVSITNAVQLFKSYLAYHKKTDT